MNNQRWMKLKKLQLIPSLLNFLGDIFDEVYTMLHPSTKDYEARQALITFFDKFLKKNTHAVLAVLVPL